jgi:hypothetical protein
VFPNEAKKIAFRQDVRNVGRMALKTLNLNVPPAYTKAGDELPRGKP